MSYSVYHYIDGKEEAGNKEQCGPLFDPATGINTGSVHFADPTIVNRAIDSASKAFQSWAQIPALKRARVLFKFKALLEQLIDEIAEIVTREHGKTLEDARGSISRGIELVEFACGIPNQLKGSFSENVSRGIDSYTLRQPLGVCAGISPFNFPVMVPVWMFIPAIACGNTFVLKPSEKDPSATIRLAELLTEAGLPPGVLNVIHGGKEVVDQLLHHPQIQAITAVSSSTVAQYIYTTATQQGKRSHTFGGAKNHCLVMDDADLDYAAHAVTTAAYGSAGERCMALSAVVTVGDKVADALVEKIKTEISHLKVGPGTGDGIDMGPLVTQEHLQRVRKYIDLGVQEGAKLVVDGRDLTVPGYENGFFMGASLFDHVTEKMKVYQDEIFGPVLVIVRADNFESALALISEHPYGNGTAIFTQNGGIARDFASRVQVGMVGINVPIPVPVTYHSFGGWKRSVFGDIAMHGDQSIQFYTKLKTITQKWTQAQGTHAYSMPKPT